MNGSEEAIRVIVIILIFPILGVNAALIIRIIRNMKFTWNSKKLTLISLATGDIVLVFSLVIYAIEPGVSYNYYGSHLLSCRTLFVTCVYRLYLINVVYCIGLVILAIELIVRLKWPVQQYTKGWKDNVLALMVSAVPWILGLIIVLPATMGVEALDACESEEFYAAIWDKTLLGVFICLPASVALVFGISVMCVRDSNDQCASSQTPSQSTAHEMSTYSVQTQPFSSLGNDLNRNPQVLNPHCPSSNVGVVMSPQQYPQTSNSHPPSSYQGVVINPARCPQGFNPHSPPSYQGIVNTPRQYSQASNSHPPSSYQGVVINPARWPQGSNPHSPPSYQGIVNTPRQYSQASNSHLPPSYQGVVITPPRYPQVSNPQTSPSYQGMVNTPQQYQASRIPPPPPRIVSIPAASSQQVSSNLRKEKVVLCNICIGFFMLLLPYALAEMAYRGRRTGSLGVALLYMYFINPIVIIIMLLRSVAIPIVWLGTMS